MRRDLRKLPSAVVARLKAAGHDLEKRTPGFDAHTSFGFAEERVTSRRRSGLVVKRSDSGESSSPVVQGYASVWGHEYDMYGGPDMSGWTESVERGSAKKSIKEQDDVRLLFDHAGLPLATTGAGTLILEDDREGLYSEGSLDPDSPYSNEIASRLSRGELDSMSFAFEVVRQEWNPDYTRRWIREVKLFDVSVVNYPANPATVAGLKAPAGEDVEDEVTDEGDEEEKSSGTRSLLLAERELIVLRATI